MRGTNVTEQLSAEVTFMAGLKGSLFFNYYYYFIILLLLLLL